MTGTMVCGRDLVIKELSSLGRFLIITDEVPWKLCVNMCPEITKYPVLFATSLEKDFLAAQSEHIPSCEAIVGIGGGSVMDAAKYFSQMLDCSAILFPSITSTNAPFTNFISVRDKGKPAGVYEENLDTKVVVDVGLIQKANPRLNRAGAGDIFALSVSVRDWELAAVAGNTDPPDPHLQQSLLAVVDRAVEKAHDIGEVSDAGIETLANLFQAVSSLTRTNPNGAFNAGSEHLFAWNLEIVTGRHFIHGEIVALGTVIMTYLQGTDYNRIISALNASSIPYKPAQLGLTWIEIEQCLLSIREYNQTVRKFYTILDEIELNVVKLRHIRELLS